MCCHGDSVSSWRGAGSAILSLERCAVRRRASRRVHTAFTAVRCAKFFSCRRDFAMASEDDSFKSTSQLLRDDSFKNSPLVTSKLSGSGSFKGQFTESSTETENTRRRCAVVVAVLVLGARPSTRSPFKGLDRPQSSSCSTSRCATAAATRSRRVNSTSGHGERSRDGARYQ